MTTPAHLEAGIAYLNAEKEDRGFVYDDIVACGTWISPEADVAELGRRLGDLRAAKERGLDGCDYGDSELTVYTRWCSETEAERY